MSLGAQVIRMTVWLDCVYRIDRLGRALYPSEQSLFGSPHPDDRAAALLPTVVLPPEESVRILYVPLGVGNHVDHQIVRAWGVVLGKHNPWLALKFYEEYPYTQDKSAIDKALTFFAACQPPLRLEREIIPLNEAEVSAKLSAIRCYESQISTFWTDAATMETATRQAMNAAGGGQPAERYWTVVRD
jgi:LmbE family N-acetylglucosaminyl deacetylase